MDLGRRRTRCAPLVLDSLEDRCLLSGNGRSADFVPNAWRPPAPPVLVAKPVTDTVAWGERVAIPETTIPTPVTQRGKPVDRAGAASWVVHSISYDGGDKAPLVQAPPTAFEVSRPHDTMSSAQVIASSDSVRLAGMMRPGDTPDYYVVPGDAVAYQVKLVSVESTGVMAPEVFLLDEQGGVVGKWTMPADTYQMTINLLDIAENAGHEFYLGIAPGVDSLDNPPDESTFNAYNLLIEPMAPSTSPPTSVGDPGGEEPSIPPATISPMPDPIGGTGPGTGGSAPVFVAVPNLLEQPRSANPNAAMITGTETSLAIAPVIGLAAGPLPSRLAAPFAGNLGTGESAPEVARGPKRATLLGLFDDAAIEEAPLAPEVPRPASSASLVAVQGPGGVPFLAAVKTHAPASALNEHDACETPAWAAALAVLTETPVSVDPDANAPALTLADNRKPDHAAERRATRPAVFSIGLSVFATLAATLVLPDFAPTVPGRSGSRRSARRPRRLSNWKRGS